MVQLQVDYHNSSTSLGGDLPHIEYAQIGNKREKEKYKPISLMTPTSIYPKSKRFYCIFQQTIEITTRTINGSSCYCFNTSSEDLWWSNGLAGGSPNQVECIPWLRRQCTRLFPAHSVAKSCLGFLDPAPTLSNSQYNNQQFTFRICCS